MLCIVHVSPPSILLGSECEYWDGNDDEERILYVVMVLFGADVAFGTNDDLACTKESISRQELRVRTVSVPSKVGGSATQTGPVHDADEGDQLHVSQLHRITTHRSRMWQKSKLSARVTDMVRLA